MPTVLVKTLLRRARCRPKRLAAPRPLRWLAAALAALLLAPQVSVAQINYGTFAGTTVDYINVTEQSTTADAAPLFGVPVLSANSIDFNPIGFDAAVAGAAGTDSTGGRLTYAIQAHPGLAIASISFFEAGDITMAGMGTDSTSAQVTASGTITISAVDGAAITPVTRPIALAFSPSGGSFGLASDGGGLPIFHTTWTGSLALNVSQILATESIPFTMGATRVSIDLVNTLTAASQAGTESFIGKKDFGFTTVTLIPEPSSLALFGLALISWMGMKKLKHSRNMRLQ